MHPLLRSRTNILLYLTVWALLGAMFGSVLDVSGNLTWQESVTVTAPLTLTLAFICLSPWYACRLMPLGSTVIWKLVGNHLLTAVMASALLLLMAAALLAGISGLFPDLEMRFSPVRPILTAVAIVMYILSIAFHYAVLAVESSRKAEVLARDAELRALKAQVNPHFLFNSLNSISALTSIDAGKAREMCIKLSDFLRTSLRLGERASITFGEEWELARTYLDVEQVRFGGRLRVTESIDAACAGCEVPPLLVQPLVENAIKHGIATLVDGGEIVIVASRLREGFRIMIENAFDPEAPRSKKSGIGIRNVRDRLRARYGSAGQLEIGIEENRYRVVLSLPCEGVERLT